MYSMDFFGFYSWIIDFVCSAVGCRQNGLEINA